jgi:hypothetical protein
MKIGCLKMPFMDIVLLHIGFTLSAKKEAKSDYRSFIKR